MANNLLSTPHSRRPVDVGNGIGTTDNAQGSGNNELYIGSLPYAATEDEIMAEFSRAGKVTKLTLIRDNQTGRSKGFGFITFSDSVAARKAKDEDTFYIRGRRIKVNYNAKKSRPGPMIPSGQNHNLNPLPNPSPRFGGGDIDPYSIYVQNIPQSAQDADLIEVFTNFGKVARAKVVLDPITKMPRGFGFVTFNSPDDVQKVLAEGSAMLHGTRMEVRSKRQPRQHRQSPGGPQQAPRFAGVAGGHYGRNPPMNQQPPPHPSQPYNPLPPYNPNPYNPQPFMPQLRGTTAAIPSNLDPGPNRVSYELSQSNSWTPPVYRGM